MKRQGANKKLYKRKGKSYEEVYDFEIQSFLGGGQYGGETTSSDSITFGVGKRGQTESYTSTKTSENRGIDSSVLFRKFPLFSRSKGIYRLGDLSSNMGIVRTRQRSITILEKKIDSWEEEIKSFGRRTKRGKNKCLKRREYISNAKKDIKKYKHEMDYRLKLLKEVGKHLDISNKGSLRKPSGKYTSYKFRIYFFGKRQIIYLGKEEDLKMGFKNNTNFDDFDEYLKDMGRKRFLQRLGKQETNVRQAQRRLSKLHNV